LIISHFETISLLIDPVASSIYLLMKRGPVRNPRDKKRRRKKKKERKKEKECLSRSAASTAVYNRTD